MANDSFIIWKAGIVFMFFGTITLYAAVIVGMLIVKTGWDIFREVSHNLTDGFNKEELDNITQIIKNVSGVRNIKNIKARKHGNNIFIDVIVIVSANLSIFSCKFKRQFIYNILTCGLS
jgi:divalent metal cation (Fe/Co/Zn/Cd) transporter